MSVENLNEKSGYNAKKRRLTKSEGTQLWYKSINPNLKQ